MRHLVLCAVLLAGCTGPALVPRDGGAPLLDERTVLLPIVSSSLYRDAQGFVHVVGEAQNKANATVGFAFVHARLYGERDAFLGERAAPPARVFVPPGERMPFDLWLTEEKDVARYDLDVTAELVPDASPAAIAVLSSSLRREADGWVVEGVLRNAGDEAVASAEVVVTLYDALGVVVAVATEVAEDARPGLQVPFEVRVRHAAGDVARHNATAQAYG